MIDCLLILLPSIIPATGQPFMCVDNRATAKHRGYLPCCPVPDPAPPPQRGSAKCRRLRYSLSSAPVPGCRGREQCRVSYTTSRPERFAPEAVSHSRLREPSTEARMTSG